MPLLEFVVGEVDTWPTDVINSIFLEAPSYSSIKYIVTFFYGNGIPFYIAHYFYCLSNNHVCDRATNIMRIHYVLWHSLKYMRHQSVYYNTTFKQLMWLNGRGLDQMEFVVPMVSDITLGINVTGRAFTINMKLLLIKDFVLQFPY
jgi:hypothetical protein